MQSKLIKKLKDDFILQYGKSDKHTFIALAPARINIIGEHIDYNGGPVFPAAVNLFLSGALRKRNDKTILYKTVHNDILFKFSIDDELVFDKKNDFANYLNGVLFFLKEAGLKLDCGFEVLILSDIPMGSGVSSSAALELCFAKLLCSAFSFDTDEITLAKIGQQVENNFLGLKSGIMDQFAIAMGKKDSAILLDTSSLKYEYIPLNLEPYRIVIMNSNKPRKLTESKYNERKAECEKALSFLQQKINIQFLCDLDIDKYKNLEAELIKNCGEVIACRVRHCVTEKERVLKAVSALKKNDLISLGKLLSASHLSLKNDYEVTGKELDSLFFAAAEEETCLGARMTGAGFSGCAIAIVHKDGFESFAKNTGTKYKKETGLDASFFACQAACGVSLIE